MEFYYITKDNQGVYDTAEKKRHEKTSENLSREMQYITVAIKKRE